MRFHVQNMTCGCARGVTKVVQSVDPEAGIEIDLHTRIVDLRTAKPGTAFATAIETAGLTAAPAT